MNYEWAKTKSPDGGGRLASAMTLGGREKMIYRKRL